MIRSPLSDTTQMLNKWRAITRTIEAEYHLGVSHSVICSLPRLASPMPCMECEANSALYAVFILI